MFAILNVIYVDLVRIMSFEIRSSVILGLCKYWSEYLIAHLIIYIIFLNFCCSIHREIIFLNRKNWSIIMLSVSSISLSRTNFYYVRLDNIFCFIVLIKLIFHFDDKLTPSLDNFFQFFGQHLLYPRLEERIVELKFRKFRKKYQNWDLQFYWQTV